MDKILKSSILRAGLVVVSICCHGKVLSFSLRRHRNCLLISERLLCVNTFCGAPRGKEYKETNTGPNEEF